MDNPCVVWFVNVGDGDSLTVAADTLEEAVQKVDDLGWRDMVNAIVREGHEDYLRDWPVLKAIGREKDGRINRTRCNPQ